MRTVLLIALLGYNVIMLTGCAGISAKDDMSKSQAILEPSSALKFIDLPVPAGFKLLAQDSYSFESSGVRVAVLKYQGRAGPDQVSSFYKEQMPMYNWNLLNIVEYGDRLMNFERENETCIISLLPKGGSVTVRVSLGPKPPKKTLDKK